MLYSVGELEWVLRKSLGDTRFKPNFPPKGSVRALRAQPDGK
jgi:hypothetical protein